MVITIRLLNSILHFQPDNHVPLIFCTISTAQSLTDFAQNSTSNGILTFILGTLFVLSIYHFLLYFQHKDRAYLYYSIYTFLIFYAYITKVETGFLKDIVNLTGITDTYADFYRWSYNCIYFVFAVKFLNIKEVNRQWFNYILYPIAVIFALALIAQLSKSMFRYEGFFNLYNKLYLPAITIHTLFSSWFILQLKGNLKWYIIIGALILFLSSIIGEYRIRTLSFVDISREVGDYFFYLGALIETICFSLGLGHKQKLIIHERNDANIKLLSKLEENEALKETVGVQYQERIDVLNEQIKFKQEIADLRLKALRSQMNPHFIFNSLNSIKLYIINNEKENAVYYLNKFAKLIRKILEASMTKDISLQEELDTSELYMNIENIRFSNAIDFIIDVDSKINTSSIKIPSLILQPFIENAIWHGLSSKEGDKKITVVVRPINTSYVRICIEDNGIGRVAAAKINDQKFTKRKSVGITITKERLADFSKAYASDFKITIKDIKNKDKKVAGTQVIIDVPIEKIDYR